MAEITKVTKKENDNKTITYEVEEISNGWILTKCTYTKLKDGTTDCDIVKRFYRENPLAETVTERKVVAGALGIME